MNSKLFFEYKRMEPFRYPEPRDIRIQLERCMANKYKDQPVSNITLATEFVLKSIVPKDGSAERPILKYQVINVDWEQIREIKDVKFERKMIRWMKAEETEYGDTGAGAY